MDKFIKLPLPQRLELITQTSAKMDMSPAAIEKDFWVCWMLRRLFQSPLKDSIIFKGGTSLSKVYGYIKRFSEDIDLILNWNEFSADTEWNPGARYGNSGRAKMLKALDEWNAQQITESILPVVQACCGNICSAALSPKSAEIIIITYPKTCVASYIRPEILLEIGPKAAWNPHAEHIVRPYMAELYPRLFHSADVCVTVTTAERAFWEKITILHAQVKRNSALPSRYARHYYDTIMMARHPELKSRAFADMKLLYQVAAFKHNFYRAGWADYPNAVPGSMHLIPTERILSELEADYENMKREMLPADAPDFSIIMQELVQLEQEINQLTPLPLDIRNYPTMEP